MNMLKNKKFAIIFTQYGLRVFDNFLELTFFYLDNQTPKNYFSDDNQNINVEKIFEDTYTIKDYEVFQIFKNEFKKRKIFEVFPHLNLYVRDIIGNKSVKELYSYDVEKFHKVFNLSKKPKKTYDIYEYFSDKVFLDFGYKLQINTPNKGTVYEGKNMREIISMFREFLKDKYKLRLSKYRAGKILKSLNGINNVYIYNGVSKITEIIGREFFNVLFSNILIKNHKIENVYILQSFFSEKTTKDIIEMIFQEEEEKKKRKLMNQDVNIYGYSLSLSTIIIDEFLKSINCGNICSAFDDDNGNVYNFVLYLRKKKPQKFLQIDKDLMVFLSIKFKNLLRKDVKTNCLYFNSLKGEYIEMLKEKTIIQLLFYNKMDQKKLIEFFDFILTHRLFYFFKCNTLYSIGNNFLTVKEMYLDRFKKKFKFIESKLKKKVNKVKMDYFKENIKFFTEKNYSGEPPRKKKKIK